MQPKDLMPFILGKAKSMILDEQGSIPPMALVLNSSGTLSLIDCSPFMDSHEGKQALRQMLVWIAKRKDIESILLHFEMWFVTVPKKDGEDLPPKNMPRPTDHPDRKEGVVIVCEHRNMPRELALFEILRDREGKAIDVSENPNMEKIEQLGGYFVDLFPR